MVFLGLDLKLTASTLMSALWIDSLGYYLQRVFFNPFIRALNYHDIAPFQAEVFEAQLVYYKKHFEVVGPTGLEMMISGRWNCSRPGLILSFDDGLRSHADVVAPLLERHGLTGWFMVPVGFIDELPEKQRLYAREHQISHHNFGYGDPRIAMTWEDIRRLSRVHEIGCHTWSHRRLGGSPGEKDLEVEIPMAKERIEVELGREVRTFAWVGGEEASYSRTAARSILEAGFCFSFMTNNQVIRPGSDLLHLQRTNIEARDPFKVVRFQLSGVLDLLYWLKRRRLNRIFSASVRDLRIS